MSLVTVVAAISVPVLVAVTSTPGINASVASDTVPPMVALWSCPAAVWGKTSNSGASAASMRLFMFLPLGGRRIRGRVRAFCRELLVCNRI